MLDEAMTDCVGTCGDRGGDGSDQLCATAQAIIRGVADEDIIDVLKGAVGGVEVLVPGTTIQSQAICQTRPADDKQLQIALVN
jgi:hypothetical protein